MGATGVARKLIIFNFDMCNKSGCTETACSIDIAPTIMQGIIISYNNVNTICIFKGYKFARYWKLYTRQNVGFNHVNCFMPLVIFKIRNNVLVQLLFPNINLEDFFLFQANYYLGVFQNFNIPSLVVMLGFFLMRPATAQCF